MRTHLLFGALLGGCLLLGSGCGGRDLRKTLLLSPSGITLEVGQTWQFEAKVVDASGNLLSDPLTWSVEGGIGEVDSLGLFTAREQGEGKVIVVGGGQRAEARVVVVPEVVVLNLSPEQVSLRPKDTVQFRVEPLDANGNPIQPIVPLWKVEPATLGTIDEKGLFRAGDQPGTGKVQVQVGRARAEASVVVIGEVASLRVEPPQAQVETGGSLRFRAIGQDAAGNTFTVAAAWSVSDPSLGSISSDGLFRAGERTGSLEVRAHVADRTATAQVTIVPRLPPPGTPANVKGVARLAGATDHGGIRVAAYRLPEASLVAETTTNAQGEFGLWLEVGEYRLLFERTGYQREERQVSLQWTNQVLQLEVTLQPTGGR